jgi:hypothetical protein
MTIPFIGWSLAAQEFRQRAAEDAQKPISVLLLGERGVGKQTMARVWRYLAGATEKELPPVDLDNPPSSLPPRCIAISTRPTSSSRSVPPGKRFKWRAAEVEPQHLGLARRAPIPDTECQGEPLPDGLAARFMVRLYMPPLCQRQIDVLALLYFFCSTFQKGGCLQLVSSTLIHRLMLDVSWWGNAGQLIQYLLSRASTCKKCLEDEKIDEITANRFLQDHPLFERPGTMSASRVKKVRWACEDMPVLIKRLPQVALTVFFERLVATLSREYENNELADLQPEPTAPLGAVRRWRKHEDWERLGRRIPTASVSELLSAYMLGLRSGEAIPSELLWRASQFETLGATLQSLQVGLDLSPADIPPGLYDWWPIAEDSSPTRRKRRQPKSRKTIRPTERQTEAYELVRKYGKTAAEAAVEMRCGEKNVYKLLKEYDTKMKALDSRSRSVDLPYQHYDERDRDRRKDDWDSGEDDYM